MIPSLTFVSLELFIPFASIFLLHFFLFFFCDLLCGSNCIAYTLHIMLIIARDSLQVEALNKKFLKDTGVFRSGMGNGCKQGDVRNISIQSKSGHRVRESDVKRHAIVLSCSERWASRNLSKASNGINILHGVSFLLSVWNFSNINGITCWSNCSSSTANWVNKSEVGSAAAAKVRSIIFLAERSLSMQAFVSTRILESFSHWLNGSHPRMTCC